MNKKQVLRQSHCALWLTGWVVLSSGAIAPLATAQIVPDNTLPVNSIVPPGCTICTITGGTEQGVNLYHSFREFSIPTGGEARFNNAPRIQTILTRVTGTSLSTIDGLLRANGTASLFLLNPHGIVFGANARLQIGGSFFASTANSVKFLDGSEFSAIDPQTPPLLAVNVPLGLQDGRVVGAIDQSGNLAVPIGQSLTLYGNTVINTGTLSAPGGIVQVLGDRVALLDQTRIDVSSPTGGGTVLIGGNYQGQGMLPRALQTYVAPTATINADAMTHGNGGNVVVWAEDTTRFYGTISARGGSLAGNGGLVEVSGVKNLTFNGFVTTAAPSGVTGTLLLDPTNITVVPGNVPLPVNALDGLWGATEDPNDQTIGANVIAALLNTNALTLEATDGIFFTPNANVFANGANTLTLHARIINFANVTLIQLGAGDVVLDTTQHRGTPAQTTQGTTVSAKNSVIGTANFGTVPQTGNLQITTGDLTAINGAEFTASTFSAGNAGGVKLTVSGAVNFDGAGQFPSGAFSLFGPGAATFVDVNNFPSGATTVVGPGATGNGGNIELTAGSLTLTQGATFSGSTFGAGNGGSVKLTVSGAAAFDGFASGAFSVVEPGATGKGGTVELTADSLTVTHGAILSGSTLGAGNAGDVTLTVRGAATFDGAGQSPRGTFDLFGPGVPSFIDASRFPSQVSTVVAPGATGNGGNIELTAGLLTATHGAILSGNTFGAGNGGSVKLTVRGATTFDGVGQFPSGPSSQVGPGATGKGGSLELTTGSLTVTQGARLDASTAGTGAAGNIVINAIDRITLSGQSTGIFASTALGSTGDGGSIRIDPQQVLIQDGATIAVNSQGSGAGGSIFLQAGRLELRDRGAITAETASTQGGNITLDVQNLLLLRHNSSISATAGTAQASGNGGNITITTPFIVSVLRENSDITANAFSGNGGNITINTNAIYGLQFQPRLTPFSDITASSQFGLSGTVALNTLNLDPSRGLTALPLNLIDSSRQIVQTCAASSSVAKGESRFIITGRGGMPSAPGDAQTIAPALDDLGASMTPSAATSIAPAASPAPSSAPAIVEAQGWITDAAGNVALVTQTSQVVLHGAILPTAKCFP